MLIYASWLILLAAPALLMTLSSQFNIVRSWTPQEEQCVLVSKWPWSIHLYNLMGDMTLERFYKQIKLTYSSNLNILKLAIRSTIMKLGWIMHLMLEKTHFLFNYYLPSVVSILVAKKVKFMNLLGTSFVSSIIMFFIIV